MESDDVSWEVDQVVPARIPGWHIHAMDSRHPTGMGQPVQLTDYEPVMLEKLAVVPAI
jgi:hypothetical protein